MNLDPFLLKKIVSLVVHLVPGVPIVMLFALLLLPWLPRLAKRCLWLCAFCLLIFSSPLVSNALVSSLENRFAPLPAVPPDTHTILVLGAGYQYRQDRPSNSVLSATSLSRVTEGIRLWRGKPDALLVTSGIGLYGESSNAESAALFALDNAVPEKQIRQFATAHDTAEEIRLVVDLVRGGDTVSGLRLVVVSSATHLPRAAQLLGYFDVEYTLAPTDFLTTDMPWYRLDSYHLLNSDRALHEYIGMLWHWLKPPATGAS